jgi:hypothetical protein
MTLEPLRHSALKKISRSAWHYKNAVESEASHLDKGSALHAVLLGGKHVTFYDRVTDSGKAAPRNGQHWDAFKAAHPDSLILTRAEVEQVDRMVQSVRSSPEAMRVLDGIKETTVYWEIMGRTCRGTPDVDGGHFVTELKSSKDADPRKFMWDSLKFDYHGALAWYMGGLAKQRGRKEMPEEAFIVCAETSGAPAVVYRVPERALEAGRRSNRLLLERLLVCEASNEFPGYSQSVVELGFPEDEPELVFGADEEAAA